MEMNNDPRRIDPTPPSLVVWAVENAGQTRPLAGVECIKRLIVSYCCVSSSSLALMRLDDPVPSNDSVATYTTVYLPYISRIFEYGGGLADLRYTV